MIPLITHSISIPSDKYDYYTRQEALTEIERGASKSLDKIYKEWKLIDSKLETKITRNGEYVIMSYTLICEKRNGCNTFTPTNLIMLGATKSIIPAMRAMLAMLAMLAMPH